MDSTLRSFLRERSCRRCEYCHTPEEYDRLPFQPDHVIAVKHGGTDDPENLAWSCYDCNLYKGPNIAGVDPESGQVIPLFHPRRDIWKEAFAYRGGRVVGLTPQGRATVEVLRINLPRRTALRIALLEAGLLSID